MNSAYLGDHRAIARTVFGHKIYVDTRDEAIAPHLLLDGQWEEWVGTALDHFLPGSVFLDVGANFGWYSLRAAKKGAKKIMAFEPNYHVFQLLTSTMEVNGIGCELFDAAVSDEQDGVVLFEVRYTAMGSGMCRGKGGLVEATEVGFRDRVRTTTLDHEIVALWEREPNLKGTPIVLKADVEGFEPKVVKGGCGVWQSPRHQVTAFIEHNPSAPDFGDMLDYLKSHRYVLNLVEHTGGIRPISREELQNVPPAEMLCFRRFSE